MNTVRNNRRNRWAAASLTAALAGTAWVGALAPAHAQLSVPEVPIDTSPVEPVVDTVTDTVNDTITDVNDTIDSTEDTVNQIVDDVTGQLPDLPVDLPEIPDLDVPDLPTVPGLPGLPGARGATGTTGAAGGSSAGKAPASSDAAGSPTGATPRAGDKTGGARRSGKGGGSRLMSTAEIVALLEEVGASDHALAAVLSPFPAAGLAEYRDDDSNRPSVELDVTGVAPVTAVMDGLITSVWPDGMGEFNVAMTDAEGHDVTYRGIDLSAAPVEPGQAVQQGDVIGAADDKLVFVFGQGALTFLSDALDSAMAEAQLYATGLRVARALFGGSPFEMVPASSLSPAPIPRSLAMLAAALLTLSALGLGVVAYRAPVSASDSVRRRILVPAASRA